MKFLVVLLFIPSALLRNNAESFVNAESTPGGVLWGKASDGCLLTQGASEYKRIKTKDETPDNRVSKFQTRHDPTATTHRTSSKRRKQSEGVSQANYAKVKAELSKKTIEVKINKTCREEMGFLFIPHSYLYVTTKDSKAAAFKMLSYIEDHVLPLTWKVYLPGGPLTATKRDASETKWYRRVLEESNDGSCDDGPDFFSRGIDSEEDDQSEEVSEESSQESSEESPEEQQLRNSIDRVLNAIYKVAEDGRKVLITEEELNSSLKEELIKYCQLLKEVDTSGTLEEHEMGSEMVVFDNLVKLLQKHGNETVFTLRRKLRNPALCMQNVDEWVLNRRGLALPDSSCKDASEDDTNLGVECKWMQFVKSNSRGENTDWYNGEEDGMVNLAKLEVRCKQICGFNGGEHSDGEQFDKEHFDEEHSDEVQFD
uniref:Pin-TSERA1 protein n=1 Tax=Plasmodium inui TaxID=52288 RepID=F1SYY2_9APIC|nr:Pin-TSERA1 [Plasmodium inui]